jgi:hypothetical protein
MTRPGHVLVGGTIQPQSKRPLGAIRQKCMDCQGGNAAEVRRCEATTCPLHPYRMGRNPYHKLARGGGA